MTGAVVLHFLPGFTKSLSAFQRCSFIPLVQGEALLARDEPGKALDFFQTAYIRARYEGNEDVAAENPLAPRTDWQGPRENIPPNGLALPLAICFALYKFCYNSEELENYLLATLPDPPLAFRYECLRADGKTVWEDPPRVENRVPRAITKGWEAKISPFHQFGIFSEEKDDWPKSRYVVTYTIAWLPGSRISSAEIAMKGPPTRNVACWYTLGPQTYPADSKGPGEWIFPQKLASRGGFPNEFVLFTNDLRDRLESIVVTHRYTPLPE